jgi:hypothetical protein
LAVRADGQTNLMNRDHRRQQVSLGMMKLREGDRLCADAPILAGRSPDVITK